MASAPAMAAVGDVTPFPTAAPAGGAPGLATLGPDGAVWFAAQYAVDPGVAQASRRTARMRWEMGIPNCCSRLVRVGVDGDVTTRGRDVFGSRQIWGLTSFAGRLWVATSEASSSPPYRIWRLGTDGSWTPTTVDGFPSDLIRGPDSTLWYRVPGGIGRLGQGGEVLPGYSIAINGPLAAGLDVAWGAWGTPALRRVGPGGATTDFPTAFAPSFITASPDGAVWYSDVADHGIGRLVPGIGPRDILGDAAFTPGEIAVSADGVAWAADINSGRMHRVEPSMTLRDITIPDAASMVSPTIGSDGNVWVSYRATSGANRFARILTGVVPVSTRAPLASGKVKAGEVLTTDPGQWSNAPTSYAYSWQRCAGANVDACSSIAGAGSSAYTVTTTDEGFGIRAVVSASNLNGPAPAVASNMLTGSSERALPISVGKSTRKRFVISTPVTVRVAGTIRQVGVIPKARRTRAVRACSPRPVVVVAPGRRVIRCTLSRAARARLAKGRQVVALTTTFVPRQGERTSVMRRVSVPRTTQRR